MAYADILPLARVKNYLRIDDTLTADDGEIESMIIGALQFVEKYTDHIFEAQDFTQYGDLKIYKYPLNSVVDQTLDEYYAHYYQRNQDQEDVSTAVPASVTFNAGYGTIEAIPQALIQAALQIVKVWYYEAEKQINDQIVPVSVLQALDTYKRFR